MTFIYLQFNSFNVCVATAHKGVLLNLIKTKQTQKKMCPSNKLYFNLLATTCGRDLKENSQAAVMGTMLGEQVQIELD